jgi:hypothetical protein
MSLPEREYDRSLNSEIERILYQLEVVREDAKGLVAGLSEAQFNWSPDAGQWSVGQCLEHLNLTARRSLPLFEQAVDKGLEQGIRSNGPYAYGYLSRFFLRVLEPPVRMRVKAPKGFQPVSALVPEKVMTEFDESHEFAQSLAKKANGLDLARIRVPSAFSKLVKYNLGMAFWILAAHDRRHIWQARQFMADDRFPK